MVFNISAQYDESRGYNEDQYRKLKARIKAYEKEPEVVPGAEN